jgi:hypothetical protein
MNPQERAELENFLDQLEQVHGVQKVAEADAMIKRTIARQPEAAYLLVQRALLLGHALSQAKTRITELEQHQQESSQGFLGSGTSSIWSAPSTATPSATALSERASTGSASATFQPAAPPNVASATSPVSAPGGAAAGFLERAAATATGVAGGAFLFEGIESLLGHRGSTAPGYAADPAFPQEDVTINNYYLNGERPGESHDSRLASEDTDDGSNAGTDTTTDDDEFV